MRETQEVERLRLAFATRAPILFRKAAKFDDSRLVGMQFQPKPRESLAQFRQKPLCFMSMLESRDKIIREASEDYISMRLSVSLVRVGCDGIFRLAHVSNGRFSST